MKKGWIKLHRQLLDSSIWNCGEPYDKRSAWIEFLLMANHKDAEIVTRRGEVVKIKSGQFFTSIDKLSERFGWSKGKVRRYLATLKTAQMCSTIRHTDGTLVTVENWALFQGEWHTDEHTDGTSDGTSDGTRTRMIKNVKNIKNKRVASKFNNFEERDVNMHDLELALLRSN